jgi:hypothetical protein
MIVRQLYYSNIGVDGSHKSVDTKKEGGGTNPPPI